MKFARIVFIGAGIWGIAVLMPFYWLHDVTGRAYVPPTEYPHFFYGFMSVALAWQIAFLVIGSNPARFRPFMIPAFSKSLAMSARWSCCARMRASPRPTPRPPCRICCWRYCSWWHSRRHGARASAAHTNEVGERHTTS